MERERNLSIVKIAVFGAIILAIAFSILYYSNQSAFAAKKYRCKVCDWLSHCEIQNAGDCEWVNFYKGDEDVENLCCPDTIVEIGKKDSKN